MNSQQSTLTEWRTGSNACTNDTIEIVEDGSVGASDNERGEDRGTTSTPPREHRSPACGGITSGRSAVSGSRTERSTALPGFIRGNSTPLLGYCARGMTTPGNRVANRHCPRFLTRGRGLEEARTSRAWEWHRRPRDSVGATHLGAPDYPRRGLAVRNIPITEGPCDHRDSTRTTARIHSIMCSLSSLWWRLQHCQTGSICAFTEFGAHHHESPCRLWRTDQVRTGPEKSIRACGGDSIGQRGVDGGVVVTLISGWLELKLEDVDDRLAKDDR